MGEITVVTRKWQRQVAELTAAKEKIEGRVMHMEEELRRARAKQVGMLRQEIGGLHHKGRQAELRVQHLIEEAGISRQVTVGNAAIAAMQMEMEVRVLLQVLRRELELDEKGPVGSQKLGTVRKDSTSQRQSRERL